MNKTMKVCQKNKKVILLLKMMIEYYRKLKYFKKNKN